LCGYSLLTDPYCSMGRTYLRSRRHCNNAEKLYSFEILYPRASRPHRPRRQDGTPSHVPAAPCSNAPHKHTKTCLPPPAMILLFSLFEVNRGMAPTNRPIHYVATRFPARQPLHAIPDNTRCSPSSFLHSTSGAKAPHHPLPSATTGTSTSFLAPSASHPIEVQSPAMRKYNKYE
jgi:hypothetical protein